MRTKDTIALRMIESKNNKAAANIKPAELLGFTISIEEYKALPQEAARYNRFYDRWAGWVALPKMQYKIKVEYNGRGPVFFTFTDSINAYEHARPVDLLDALVCWLGDIVCAINAFSPDEWVGVGNLMNELGYEDIKEARDIYRALLAEWQDARTLGLSDDQIFELLEKPELEAHR